MKWLAYGLAGVAIIVAIVFLLGAAVPRTHTARVRAQYRAAPERIYAAIHDVAQATGWRTGLKEVAVLSGEGEPLRWRETSDFGTLTFVLEEAQFPRRIVARIADESQGFGGSWTYEITPHSEGSTLTITENGEVRSALFRFFSRYVFGYYRTMEAYARDLARKLGEETVPVRVKER